ncbi:MAG: hydroxylamine reductase [Planctomycetes bacterium RBG_13_44_8b]|nr:MAG: hydroxylamine reductase [Planctomycetes bacterium RBG_13_44_8b]
MFCYQCEQTAKGTGCTALGVCGKEPQTAALQDLLVYAVKDISRYAHRAYKLGMRDREVDIFMVEALFSTLTNVNFDPQRFTEFINQAAGIKKKAVKLYEDAQKKAGRKPEVLNCPVAWWEDTDDLNKMVYKGESVSIQKRMDKLGEDVTGLQELITYGLKGAASYADHAQILGKEDTELYAQFHEILNYLTVGPKDADELLQKALDCGRLNLKAMGLLDSANTDAYGHPEPTKVRITPVKGKCIVVSGHDLKDLEELLKQTEGKGINVYTHGEMLPCNAYPGLKKYKHLVGNYGGPWQEQRKEFDEFPGAILMTTNCLQKPKDSYKHRIFTSGVVGWDGVTHISNRDFTPVIKAALAEPGFTEDTPEKYILTGFAHNAVMSVAGKVIELVKQGKIRHFFLIGGCDGARPGRNYYTEFAQKVPNDCIILTLACGKYRFNKLEFGQIDGIPRLLDCGQCNDAYSAIQIATALAGAFNCGVNDLPLSLILSWFEQKAVAILLTLLYLGIKNIRIGPSLPAFVTPNALKILVDKFNVKPIGNVDDDLAEILIGSTGSLQNSVTAN